MRIRDALLALCLAVAPVAGRAADASVVLRWKPVDAAVAYELEIAADAGLRRVVLSERVPSPGYRWRELPDERRWWRVRGIDAYGRAGRWSEVRVLEPVLRIPEPSRPADDASFPEGTAVELACAPSPAVESYELEVAADAEFAQVVERRTGPEPRFAVALRAGAYHWRVRAKSLDGKTTRWSPPRRITATAVAAAKPPEPEPPPIPAAPPAPPAVSDEEAAGAAAAASEAALAASVALEVPGALGGPTPAPPPAPEPATPPEPTRGHWRAGARLGWHTNLHGISSASPGVLAEWRFARPERLALSLRVDYYDASSTIPPLPGVAFSTRATARVVPLGAALVWTRPLPIADVYAGAGGQVQLVHSVVAWEERLDAAAGALLLAGAARRLGRGDLFVEAAWATGAIDAPTLRLRTGGLHLAVGFRGGP